MQRQNMVFICHFINFLINELTDEWSTTNPIWMWMKRTHAHFKRKSFSHHFWFCPTDWDDFIRSEWNINVRTHARTHIPQKSFPYIMEICGWFKKSLHTQKKNQFCSHHSTSQNVLFVHIHIDDGNDEMFVYINEFCS